MLADHPASDGDKLVALAMLTAVLAASAQAEASPVDLLRSTRYLAHLAAQGNHPHLAALATLTPAPPSDDPLPEMLRRILTGLLPVS